MSDINYFKINFAVKPVNSYPPAFQLQVSTEGPIDELTDSDILIIKRLGNPSESEDQRDVFFGIAKAVDFKALRKKTPFEGQNLYRAHNWTLIFYSEQTMNESISLMKQQVDILAAEVKGLRSADRNRSESHISNI